MATRPIRRPPRDFASRPLPVRELRRINGVRVHSDPWPAIGFRKVTTHRFSHPDTPEGLMYLAEDLETCLWECFGDQILDPGSQISLARWSNNRASRITLRKPLVVCDLTDLGTRRRLGMDLAALNHPDLSIPQAWGLAIQTHPDEVDGLLFPSRFTGKPCLVVFDRPSTVAKLASKTGKLLPEVDEASEFLAKNSINLV